MTKTTKPVEVSTNSQPKWVITQPWAVEALLARLAWLTKPQITKASAAMLCGRRRHPVGGAGESPIRRASSVGRDR